MTEKQAQLEVKMKSSGNAKKPTKKKAENENDYWEGNRFILTQLYSKLLEPFIGPSTKASKRNDGQRNKRS